jgi:hypothetical protein
MNIILNSTNLLIESFDLIPFKFNTINLEESELCLISKW